MTFLTVAVLGVLCFCAPPGGPRAQAGDEVKMHGEWGPPEKLPDPVNRGLWQDGPAISPDGQTLYFTRGRDRDVSTYVTRREGSRWTEPKALDFNLKSFPTGAPYTQDDRLLYAASIRPGGFGLSDLYVSRFDGRKWSQLENLGGVINTDHMESEPYITPDGGTLYFASTRPGGLGETDIYTSTKTASGWAAPVNLGPPVNSDRDETQPRLSYDGRELYFVAVNRDGVGGPAIFKATKAGSGWGKPVLVASGFVGEPTLTADNRSLYFVHLIRKGGKLVDAEIMVSRRRP